MALLSGALARNFTLTTCAPLTLSVSQPLLKYAEQVEKSSRTATFDPLRSTLNQCSVAQLNSPSPIPICGPIKSASHHSSSLSSHSCSFVAQQFLLRSRSAVLHSQYAFFHSHLVIPFSLSQSSNLLQEGEKQFLDSKETHFSFSQPSRFKSRDKGAGKGGKGKGSKGGARVRFDESFGEVIDHHQFQSELEEAFNRLADDLASQCSAKSGAGVFDRLEVNTVDGVFSLNELGTIIQKSSSLAVVNMSSLPNYIPDVIAAVQNSNLNVNAQQDGSKIVLPLPKVTKDHRVRLAAEAKRRLESMKVDSRQIFAKHTKSAKSKKESGTSEDTIFSVEKWLKQQMDESIGKAEALVKEKQEEVLDPSRG